MRLQAFKPKKEDHTAIAMELKDFLNSYITSSTFSMVEDLKERDGTTLFKIKDDVFKNEPLNIDLKWNKKKR
jgi:hypothetical protein